MKKESDMETIKEYIVWNNCNNSCSFCFLKTKLQSTYEQKFESLDLVEEDIRNTYGGHMLVMGGEIFAEIDAKIQNRLKEVFTTISEKMVKNEIGYLYMNTNLLYRLDFLLSVLDVFKEKNILDRIKFTTSYDVAGRFKSESAKKLFKDNIKYLSANYSPMPIVANTILSNAFCEEVLSGNYSIVDSEKELGVTINPIPYIHVMDDGLMPTRKQVVDTLFALDKQQSNFLKIYCQKMMFDQPRYLLQFGLDANGYGFLENVTAPNAECGHCVNFRRCFSDSDDCFVCLIDKIRKMVYGNATF